MNIKIDSKVLKYTWDFLLLLLLKNIFFQLLSKPFSLWSWIKSQFSSHIFAEEEKKNGLYFLVRFKFFICLFPYIRIRMFTHPHDKISKMDWGVKRKKYIKKKLWRVEVYFNLLLHKHAVYLIFLPLYIYYS